MRAEISLLTRQKGAVSFVLVREDPGPNVTVCV